MGFQNHLLQGLNQKVIIYKKNNFSLFGGQSGEDLFCFQSPQQALTP
jgi:hypothetical protein